MNVQGKGGGVFASRKGDCVGGATPIERDAIDAGAYFALLFFVMQGLRAVRERRPHSASHVVFCVDEPTVFERPEIF